MSERQKKKFRQNIRACENAQSCETKCNII